MNWLRNAALAALLVSVATPAFAQRDSTRAPRGERGERARAEMRDRMGFGFGGGGGVESILRNRESLKLTEAQVNELEALRKQIVAERKQQAGEMIELQSRIAAGQLDRDEMQKQMESRRDALRNETEQRRERVEKILTAEQREELQRMPRRSPRGPGGPPIPGRYRWN